MGWAGVGRAEVGWAGLCWRGEDSPFKKFLSDWVCDEPLAWSSKAPVVVGCQVCNGLVPHRRRVAL